MTWLRSRAAFPSHARPPNHTNIIVGTMARSARDQPPQPRRHLQMDESLHHNLPGQRPGNRGILPRGQQRHRKQRTAHPAPTSGLQPEHPHGGHFEVSAAMKHRRRHNQNPRVHKQRAEVNASGPNHIYAPGIASRLPSEVRLLAAALTTLKCNEHKYRAASLSRPIHLHPQCKASLDCLTISGGDGIQQAPYMPANAPDATSKHLHGKHREDRSY